MPQSFVPPVYPFRKAPEQRGASRRHKVAVIGAGPVGLSAAIDLALHGVPVVLLDEDDTVSTGSRAICWAKRTLEIFDRLGVVEPMMERGITWSRGKVFFGERLVYGFDLLPEGGHRFPAFINLQQYYVEHFLAERALSLDLVDLRWRHRVTGLQQRDDHVVLDVATPEGAYTLQADWVLAADGAKSPTRRMLGLDFVGRVFEDRFLIADVKMEADFPAERRFWFDPPFHRGQSALLHKQADNVWRIDLQLGWQADPEEEKRPERVLPRLVEMLGPAQKFELEWVSVYTFQCRRLERFRHGRVFFVGDSAHQVSPFGARGGNSGVQDVDNLAWKLALAIGGEAPETLLDSYDAERIPAADENIGHSTRATDFISPKGRMADALRKATLELAERHDFARAMVNSGRLSRATFLAGSPLSTPDEDDFSPAMAPGTPLADAKVPQGWLLDAFRRGDFAVLHFAPADAAPPSEPALRCVSLPRTGLAAERYDAAAGATYLVRPDQHVAARWRGFDRVKLDRALRRAKGLA